MIPRQDIVDFARSLIGRKYHPGLNPDCDALDCVGVVHEVARHFGIVLPLDSGEGRPVSYTEAYSLAAGALDSLIFVEEPLLGDFMLVNVCLNPNTPGRVHFGIVADSSLFEPWGFISTDSTMGQVVEQAFDVRYLKHRHQFCHFVGVG